MSDLTQTLEDMMVRIPLEVPVNIHREVHVSLSAAGGDTMKSENMFTEYLMPDEWTPENVKMSFKDEIKQDHTREQYEALLVSRATNLSAYGRISIGLDPLVDVETDGIKSTSDGLVQTIKLDVPVHFNHNENYVTAASGHIRKDNLYSVEFLLSCFYQHPMPKNVSGFLPSYVRLFLQRDEFVELLEKRREKECAYGRISIELNPLIRQD